MCELTRPLTEPEVEVAELTAKRYKDQEDQNNKKEIKKARKLASTYSLEWGNLSPGKF